MMSLLGAETVAWTHKTECCGAGLSIPRPDLTVRLVGGVAAAARRAGAKALVVACPLCFLNLDTRQEAERALPVFYFTELVGLALGLNPWSWLDQHLADPWPALNAAGISITH